MSAPCPFIAKWGTDIRILLENNLVAWNLETMNGWDSMLSGYYISARMTFDAKEPPEEILNDLWTRFYGPAAKPMASYWTGIDKAYLDAREYAGSPYGYLSIFTPEVMRSARADLVAALKAAGKPDGAFSRQVKLIDESFGLFEQFMAMRNDWADGKLADLDPDYEAWRTDGAELCATRLTHARMEMDAQPQPGDGCVSPDCVGLQRQRLAGDACGPRHLEFYRPSLIHDRRGIRQVGPNGLPYVKEGGPLPKGKKAFLWIGMTDGRARIFVNGQHIE